VSAVLRPLTTTLQVDNERRAHLVYSVQVETAATVRLEVIEDHPGDEPDVRIGRVIGGETTPWSAVHSAVLGSGESRQAWALLSADPPLRLEPDPDDPREMLVFAVQLASSDAAGRIRLRLERPGQPDEVSAWTWFDPDRIVRWQELLPSVYQAAIRARPDGPLPVLLKCMDSMLAPVEREAEDFAAILDPYRTRPEFLPMLGAWLAAGTDVADALPPNRAWLASAVDLAQRRGTADGLERTLRLASGMPGFEVDERTERFHVSFRAPVEAIGLEDALRHLIEAQRPAHVTYDLLFGGAA